MQHLENDMEDLFRRAGENYSPQKGKGDWENIAKRIAQKSAPPIVIRAVRNRNKKIIIFLFLLFFISGTVLTIKNSFTETTAFDNQKQLSKATENTPGKARTKIYNHGVIKNDKAPNLYTAKTTDDEFSIKTLSSSGNALQKRTSLDNPAYGSTTNIEGSNKGIQENDLAIEMINKKEIDKKETYSFGPGNSNENFVREFSEIIMYGAKNLELSKSSDIILKQNDNSSSIEKKKSKALVTSQKKGLYFGLIAAPDFSKVQSPSFHNAGFDAGFLAGFRINTKLSVETGIIWNKKTYSSEGKNFSIDKVNSTMPAGMMINDLESHSSLIEIPLKVKYDFARKRNSDFFIAAGISSYMMTKEKNMYNVTMNGNQENISGVYEKDNYGIPAVFNISIGYEHKVGKNIAIRTEPFFKVPLKGMGVGSLPVTSAGLQIGITSRLK